MIQRLTSMTTLAAMGMAAALAVTAQAAQPPTSKLIETVQRAAEKSLDNAQRCCRTLPIASKAREECFDASNKAAVRLAEGQSAAEAGDPAEALAAFQEADNLARKATASCPGASGSTDPFSLIERLDERAGALATRISRAEEVEKSAADAALQTRIGKAKELLGTIQEALKLARTHLAAGQRPEASQKLGEAEEAAHEAASIVLTRAP